MYDDWLKHYIGYKESEGKGWINTYLPKNIFLDKIIFERCQNHKYLSTIYHNLLNNL